jgi:hypothetical protein
VERFHAATAGKAPLAEILGEQFPLIRTDGARYDRSGYVAKPASLETYELGSFKATRTVRGPLVDRDGPKSWPSQLSTANCHKVGMCGFSILHRNRLIAASV